MRLYLVRHGEAEPEHVNPERPLTQKGKEGVVQVAEFLRELGIRVPIIWHSVKKRAEETARIIAETASPNAELTRRKNLSPNDPVNGIREEIERQRLDLMIVGHLPFLPALAVDLLGVEAPAELLRLPEAGVVCLQRSGSKWQMVWMTSPERLQNR
ncbi:MAG: phosphohistidine phosphatase SixA [Candidatus Omnitrophica bacterium]|nr:phosphohistidine phosphatase SixA [Candidatus Omnitrophota bacterium]